MFERSELDNHVRGAHTASLWLYALVVLCFLPHLFSYTASMTLYVVILSITCLLFTFSDLIIRIENNYLPALWVLAIVVTIVSLLLSNRSLTAIFDVITLSCAMILVVFFNRNGYVYYKGIKLIFYISLLFAIGILIQLISPQLYHTLIGVLPSGYANAVLENTGGLIQTKISGFTTNAGSSASYIIVGIIAYISLMDASSREKGITKVRRGVVISFLVLMLLFTGKRGPTLFLLLSIIARYLIPSRGNEKIKKLGVVFFVILALITAIVLLEPYIAGIPFVGRTFSTISGLISGDDVSSSRLSLYAWAIKLFKENPILGIGWGNYRMTVVGNATRLSDLDTHNIYLQLLCETGIIGFIVFLLLFVVFWKSTKDALNKVAFENTIWKPLIIFSFTYQTYFLMYGLTGNPLYDQHFQIIYALSCAILLAYNRANSLTSESDLMKFGGTQ